MKKYMKGSGMKMHMKPIIIHPDKKFRLPRKVKKAWSKWYFMHKFMSHFKREQQEYSREFYTN